MISVLGFFLIISTGGFFVAAFHTYRYEDVLSITCMSLTIILFLFGIFDNLLSGVYIIIALSVIIYVFSLIVLFIKSKRVGLKSTLKAFSEHFFTVGFFAFLLVFMFGVYCNSGRLLTVWDEFSHWGIVVKQMTDYDVLGASIKATRVVCKSYPPIMSLMQYFIQKLHVVFERSSAFSEWRLYLAYQLFMASFLMPIFRKLSFRQWSSYLIICIILLTPMICFDDAYTVILVDCFLGIVSGSAMAQIFIDEKSDIILLIRTALTIIVLILAKSAGILFALCLAIAFYLKFRREKTSRTQRFILISYLIFPAISTFLLWKYYLKKNGVIDIDNASFSLNTLKTIILDKDNTYIYRILKEFFLRLGSEFSISGSGISLTFACLMCMFLFFLVFALTTKSRELNISVKNAAISEEISEIVLIILYVIGLCFMYIFHPSFGKNAGIGLPAFQRYMRIITAQMTTFVVYVFCSKIKETGWHPKRKFFYLLFLLLIVLSCISGNAVQLITRQSVKESQEQRWQYDELCRKIQACSEENSNIWIIDQKVPDGYGGYLYYISRFLLSDDRNTGNQPSIGKPSDENRSYTLIISAKQWEDLLLASWDYVALLSIDEEFVNEYGKVFLNCTEIEEGAVFKVNKASGKLVQVA